MDFAIFSRIAGTVLTPSNLLPLLLILGIFLQWTAWRRLGKGMIVAVAVIFTSIYFLPLDRWLSRPLQDRFPRPPWPARVDGIVVLSGGEGRLFAGAELARRYPNAKLIYSGGAAPLQAPQAAEATVAAPTFEAMGVPASRIMLEVRSRNTWESLIFSKQLAEPRSGETWVLVTSGTHLPRAVGIASHLHWHVLPWPSDYIRNSTHEMDWDSSVAERLVQIEAAVHEWVGLGAYQVMGRLGTR